MKLDRLKFAELIGYVSSFYRMEKEDIEKIDSLIDIKVPVQTNHVPCEAVDELLMLMAEGTRKIEAIKAYRSLTGAYLKEAKDAVERYWNVSKKDTRVDSMIKKIDEQMDGYKSDVDYVLNSNGDNSLSAIKDFIKSFTY